jgi:predicted dithiol-disulfide oxidoreductase (DUF899 family)
MEHQKVVSRDEWLAGGLDMLNGAYHFMDLAPKGRDEEGLSFSMSSRQV